jgi:hypothetical protein
MVMAIERKYLRQAEKEGVFILVVIRLYELRGGQNILFFNPGYKPVELERHQ